MAAKRGTRDILTVALLTMALPTMALPTMALLTMSGDVPPRAAGDWGQPAKLWEAGR